MEAPVKPKLTWKTLVFPLLGLMGFFLYIYLFNVDLLGILQTAQTANPLIYGAAIACGLLEVLFYTVSWVMLTKHLDIKITLRRAYLYVWYGLYVDIVIPAESISGEIARAYLLARDQCGSFGKVVASLFTHRLLGMAMNVIVIVFGVVLLSVEGQVAPVAFGIIILIAVAITVIMAAMTLLAFKKLWTLKIIDWATNLAQKLSRGRWTLVAFREQAFQISDHFHDSMTGYRHNGKPLIKSLFYLALTWFFGLSVPYLVFQSLGHPVSWSIILITASIVLAIKSIPIGIPFEIGIPEAAMTTLYIAMGVDPGISATATILSRIVSLWFRFFIGFAAQQWLELKPVINAPTAYMEKTKNESTPN